MEQVIEKNRCCGCGACYSICPKQAISIHLDDEGFEYPEINQDLCVNCHLCQNVCPVLQYEKNTEKRNLNCDVQCGFVARNRNYAQRLVSSSGSIFPPIAEWILDNDGIVVGAAFDENFSVVHKVITDKSDLPSLQGSKYLQMRIDRETFILIRRELQNGRKVLYSGMACQVEGLKSFLGKEYDNLYTIDLICMGIPSYRVWHEYLNAFFPNENIKSINFKDKRIGWDSFTFRIETNKRQYLEKGMHNLYLQSMFRSWNMRLSCFQCPFKKAVRISDFTLADAWGVSKQCPQINDNKGLSSIVIHSSKALNLWNEIESKFDRINVSIDDIAKGNSNLISNKPQMGDRALFYRMLKENPKIAFEKLCMVKERTIVYKILHKLRGLI